MSNNAAIKESRRQYESASADLAHVTTFKTKTEDKADKMAATLSALSAEVSVAQGRVDEAMSRYLNDESTEADISACRSELTELARKAEETRALFSSLTAEANKATEAIKPAKIAVGQKHKNFWHEVSVAEKARALELGTKAMQRAYIAYCQSMPAGVPFPKKGEFVRDLFEFAPLTDTTKDAMYKEMETEYGVPGSIN